MLLQITDNVSRYTLCLRVNKYVYLYIMIILTANTRLFRKYECFKKYIFI